MNRLLESFRDPALEAAAEALYSERLPYHNFEHILDTLDAAAVILERCKLENIRINPEVVYYALLFHDAGYQDDHKALGFQTKEAYSASLAEQALAAAGIASSVQRKTIDAILATERDARFISAEQKAVRAADLSGMAADYPDFLQKSLRLKQEVAVLHGKNLTWSAWQATSNEVLSFYLGQDIRLTSYFFDESGESQFHSAVRRNLRMLLAETSEPTLT